MKPLFMIQLRYEQDVVQARQRTRELAEQLGFDVQDQARLATAVSEIARNAFQYGQNGTVEFSVTGHPQTFLIRIQDQGGGIPHLADVLAGTYTSTTGMGLGIIGTRKLMDSFTIESLLGQGTTVIMGKLLPKQAPVFTDSQLQQIRAAVMKRSPQNPYEEIQQQNQELLQAMAELRKRKEQLTQLNRELEETNRGVVALYAELDEKASSLQQANELKTRFLSNMSHEFRTPLNAILSLSQLLLARMDGDLTTEQEKQVTFIQKAANGLVELVNDLLDLAKVEAGKIEVYPSVFAVSDLFATLRGMLRPLMIQNSAVTLIVEEPPELPPLYSDEGKLAQILRNFVSNALKFTESGEVRVTAVQREHQIIFSVSDTGIGIAPADQARIFEDFVQIESPLQKHVKGTGLGLPLSRKLAELLGGSISLSSELGQGSTFTVAVPITYPKVTKLPPALGAPWQPERQPILVISERTETLAIYEKYLQASRYKLIVAHTLTQARQTLQQLQPAAILLDSLLSAQQDWTFLQELNSNATICTVPLLVVTVPDRRTQALALGADEVLTQPVERLSLLNTLNRLTCQDKCQKLLIIDNNSTSRYVVKQLLAETTLQIVEAENGTQGLALAHREQPTAILLDLEMPDISGFEVLAQLKGNPSNQSIQVIIHSSAQLDAETQQWLTEQGITILSKATISQVAATSSLQETLLLAGLVMEAKEKRYV